MSKKITCLLVDIGRRGIHSKPVSSRRVFMPGMTGGYFDFRSISKNSLFSLFLNMGKGV
jgi:hypothetical protein